jgi:hypothetical protein
MTPPSTPSAAHRALDDYAVDDSSFLHDPSGIHGCAHSARVLVWSNAIANSLAREGESVDLEAVRWASVFHDVRRLNDGKDPEHGARSASWVRASELPQLAELGSEQRERIAYCCEWHVPNDHEAPVMTAELACLKDADSLDRVRLRSLDVSFLRTPQARALVWHARALFASSESRPSNRAWDSVRSAAFELGFWSRDSLVDYVALGSELPHCSSC